MSLLKPLVAVAAIALVAAACTKKDDTAADAASTGADAASTGAATDTVTPAPMPTDATGSVSSTGATGATGATAVGGTAGTDASVAADGVQPDSANPVPQSSSDIGAQAR
jgi:hypothetical protein